MNEEARWSHLIALDEELLKGGVILSEWCAFIVKEADIAFVHGAFLASILTAVSGVETYLRSEYGSLRKESLFDLIDKANIAQNVKKDLQKLRKYRNKWVHVNDAWDDTELLNTPDKFEKELEKMAFFAVKTMRKTIYGNPWI